MARIVTSVATPCTNPSVLDLSSLLASDGQPSTKRVKDLIEEFEEKANNRVPRIRQPPPLLSVNLSRSDDPPRSLTITFDAGTELYFSARSVNQETYDFRANVLPNQTTTARFRVLIEPYDESSSSTKANETITAETPANNLDHQVSEGDSDEASIDRVLGPLRSHLSSDEEEFIPPVPPTPLEDEPPLFASRQLAEMAGVPQRQGESVLETLVRSHTIGIKSKLLDSLEEETAPVNILQSSNVVSIDDSDDVSDDDVPFTPSRTPLATSSSKEEPLLMIPLQTEAIIVRPREIGPSYEKDEVLTQSPSSQAFPTDWAPHLRRTVSSSLPLGSGQDGQKRDTKSVAESSDSDESVKPAPEPPADDFLRYSQRMTAVAADPPKMTRARKRREQRKRRREKLRSELGSLIPESGFASQMSGMTPLSSQRKKFSGNGNISGYVHERGAVIVANFHPRNNDEWSQQHHRDTVRAERVFNQMKRLVPQQVSYHVHGHHHGHRHYHPQTFAMNLTNTLVEEALKQR